jgi:Zn-dependent protease with chaperone function
MLINSLEEAGIIRQEYKPTLLEAVYKRHPVLIQCEKLLDQYIQKVTSPLNANFFDSEKILQEVQTLLGKHFGYSELVISNQRFSFGRQTETTVYKDGNTVTGIESKEVVNFRTNFKNIDAHTFKSISVQKLNPFVDDLDIYENTGYNIRYKPGMNSFNLIHISPAMVAAGLNGAELLAILLHEIGHDFYNTSILTKSFRLLAIIGNALEMATSVVIHYITRLPSILVPDNLITQVIGAVIAFFESLATDVMYMIKHRKMTNALVQSLGVIGEFINTIFGIVGDYATTLKNIFVGPLLLILALPKQLLSFFLMDGLTEEKFCDEFAAIHGYGGELASALMKTKNPTLLYDSNQGTIQGQIAVLSAYFKDWSNSAINLLDPHPSIQTRANYMADALKSHLKHAKTPEERALINSQLRAVIKGSYLATINRNITGSSKDIENAMMTANTTSSFKFTSDLFASVPKIATDLILSLFSFFGPEGKRPDSVLKLQQNLVKQGSSK